MKTLPVLNTKHSFIARLEPAHGRILLLGAERQQFEAGETIFHEGQPANRFYLVESGEIALETHSAGCGPILIQTVSANEVLGWSWLFPPYAWHFSARVTIPASVICCDGARLLVTSEENHDFGHALLKLIANLVIQRLQATRKQLVRLESVIPSAAALTRERQ